LLFLDPAVGGGAARLCHGLGVLLRGLLLQGLLRDGEAHLRRF